MEVLAIIPARGESKGIPRKNILPVAGRPLLSYVVEAAMAARSVTRVVVSTDDSEIAGVAESLGAGVVRRPAEISGDLASSESALLHTLEFLRNSEGYQPELVVFLQCTSPLTIAEDIDGTVQALLDDQADTALTVTQFHYFLWRRSNDGAEGINHDRSVRLRRQDSPEQLLETGAVYVMRTAGFLESGHRFFGRTALYVVPQERSLEIDEAEDLKIADILLRDRREQEKCLCLPNPVKAVAMDFDGVFTDNRVLVLQDGTEGVFCSRGDGMGLDLLSGLGIPTVVLSTEVNPVVAARCRKLSIPCRQGLGDKASQLLGWLADLGVDPKDAVFLGNDVNDLQCLRAVGCGVVVHDAHPDAKAAARCILNHRGGDGAIRELVDLILEQRSG